MLLVVESSPCSPNRLLEDHRNAQHLCRPLPNYTILVEFKLQIVIFPTRKQSIHVACCIFTYRLYFHFFLSEVDYSRLLSVGHLWQHWYPQDDPDIQREFPSTSVIKLFLKMSSTCFFVNSIGKKISSSVVSSKTIQSPASLLRKTPGNVSKLEHLRS